MQQSQRSSARTESVGNKGTDPMLHTESISKVQLDQDQQVYAPHFWSQIFFNGIEIRLSEEM